MTKKKKTMMSWSEFIKMPRSRSDKIKDGSILVMTIFGAGLLLTSAWNIYHDSQNPGPDTPAVATTQEVKEPEPTPEPEVELAPAYDRFTERFQQSFKESRGRMILASKKRSRQCDAQSPRVNRSYDVFVKTLEDLELIGSPGSPHLFNSQSPDFEPTGYDVNPRDCKAIHETAAMVRRGQAAPPEFMRILHNVLLYTPERTQLESAQDISRELPSSRWLGVYTGVMSSCSLSQSESVRAEVLADTRKIAEQITLLNDAHPRYFDTRSYRQSESSVELFGDRDRETWGHARTLQGFITGFIFGLDTGSSVIGVNRCPFNFSAYQAETLKYAEAVYQEVENNPL